MPALTVVTGSFSADHQKPYGAERHGHDWHVRAALPQGGHKDKAQDRLDFILDGLNGGFIDEHMDDPSNEGLAEWLGLSLDAGWVYVWRFDRGREFGGWWKP